MTHSASSRVVPQDDRVATSRDRAEGFARAHRHDALARGEAVVVGNRAGVVEWTSTAWAHLTGFPVAETIDKPITHFLEHADLEVEFVDFVAQHFLEGRRCTVALPFDTLDGRRLDLELDVEPMRSASGEIDRFLAVVREVPEPIAPAITSERPTKFEAEVSAAPVRDRRRHALAVAPIAAGAIARARAARPTTFAPIVDAEFEEAFVPVMTRAVGAPGHAIASARLATVLGHLVEATLPEPTPDATGSDPTRSPVAGTGVPEPAWGPSHLTVLTGRLQPGRSHHSQAHAIPLRAVAAYRDAHTFLEVHDTSPHLDREAISRIRAGAPSSDARERAYVAAQELAERLGARLFLDSTAGCGNQIVVVFDVRNDAGGEGRRM